MYLGLCSITFRDKSVDELLQLVQEHQLNTIEWGSDVHVRPDDLEQVRAIGRKSAEAGLQEISYGTYYRVGEEENDHSFEELVQAAQALGAKELRVWAGKKGSALFSEADVERLVSDLQACCRTAAAEGLGVILEYHRNTYTDTPETARELLEAADEPNLTTAWQPDVIGDMDHHQRCIEILGPWIDTIHVFQWDELPNRYPLADGLEAWKQYVAWLRAAGFTRERYLLEFVRGDEEAQFAADAEALKQIVEA